ncbi:MAG: NAD(P)-dependent oxidoreductase [Candidatus Diapherotrites archaeon]
MSKGNSRNVLVTGINGFIGSHLARTLLDKGFEVHGISRTPGQTPYLKGIPGLDRVPLHAGDILDAGFLTDLFAGNEFEGVFHLASQSDTWKSTQHSTETWDVNVNGTLNLMETLRKQKKDTQVLIMSSVRVFQSPSSNHGNPELIQLHPYDASKWAAEVLSASYFHTYGINGTIARSTNVYGSNDYNFSRLIPRIMKGVFVDQKVQLRGDGQLKRDFMHISDTVSGLLAMYEKIPSSQVKGKSLTLATGKSYSIREMVDIIQEESGKNIPVEWEETHSMHERDHPVIDTRVTEEVLNWKARMDIHEGLHDTEKWYQDYFQKVKK